MATIQITSRRRHHRLRPMSVHPIRVGRSQMTNGEQVRRRRNELLAARYEMLASEEDRAAVATSRNVLENPGTAWTEWTTVKERLGLA